MQSNGFEHLKLPLILYGKPKLHSGGGKSQRTENNKVNRINHGAYIKRRSSELSRFWVENQQLRVTDNLPVIKSGIPILLEIDPESDIDFVRGLGFEIVTELDEGFIIVASKDTDLHSLNEKVDEFVANITFRCNTPAKIYALCDLGDRIKRILSAELYGMWQTLDESATFYFDIGVSCSGGEELPKQPSRNLNENEEQYSARFNRWRDKFIAIQINWDEVKREREESIENFVGAYGGEILDYIDDSADVSKLPDSFSARIHANGKCIKDLAMNYGYIFEIVLSDIVTVANTQQYYGDVNNNIHLLCPTENAPIVCVIDSGMQEEHQYLSPAILCDDSICLIPNETSVADQVSTGGHGTRVAGAILYFHSIPTEGTYQMPCWLRNVKVLNRNAQMSMNLYPPKVIEYVVEKYNSKIFNHSIGSNGPCELKQMSAWAAAIDYQSYKHDILFIQAAGNIHRDVIKSYIMAGHEYPEYLLRNLSRLCDPANSLQALTVGSVSHSEYETPDKVSLGKLNEPSSFSRTGPGIWDYIKPDVVEYGGTQVINKNDADIFLTTPEEVCPELIRRSPEGPAFAKDDVGTSFAAPQVTHIAAMIENILPDSSSLLYRALIANSASWPEWTNLINQEQYPSILRKIGYGIPDLLKSTHNNEYRVTLITDQPLEIGEGEAHVFRIPIPEELSNVGENYSILVEVTLSYASNPRRTRRSIKRYLSTWLDWCCSRMGEEWETFAKRIFETGSSISDDGDFSWMIGDAIDKGKTYGFSRKNGTLLKDWTIIKSNQLSDAFCIAVRGHKGWGSLYKAKYALVVSFEALDQDIAIYESIRSMVEVEIENSEIEVSI